MVRIIINKFYECEQNARSASNNFYILFYKMLNLPYPDGAGREKSYTGRQPTSISTSRRARSAAPWAPPAAGCPGHQHRPPGCCRPQPCGSQPRSGRCTMRCMHAVTGAAFHHTRVQEERQARNNNNNNSARNTHATATRGAGDRQEFGKHRISARWDALLLGLHAAAEAGAPAATCGCHCSERSPD